MQTAGFAWVMTEVSLVQGLHGVTVDAAGDAAGVSLIRQSRFTRTLALIDCGTCSSLLVGDVTCSVLVGWNPGGLELGMG